MARAPGMDIVKHPNINEIHEMILNHVPARQIVSRLSLDCSSKTIERYRKRMILSALESNVKTLKTIAKPATTHSSSHTKARAVNAILDTVAERTDNGKVPLRNRLEDLIDDRFKRRRRWMNDAESYQSVDPITGEVRHNMSHGALAKHDSNEARDIEVLAKLGGLLAGDPTTATQVNLVVYIPPSKSEL